MQPGKYNIRIVRGDDFSEQYGIANQVNGSVVPINLTGWTAEASIIELIGGLTQSMTATIPDPVNGLVLVELSRAITVNFQEANANWYLALTSPLGKKNTYLAGMALPLKRGGFT